MAAILILLSWLVLASGQFVDEMQSYEPECLEDGAFYCLGGGCVSQAQYCDGRYDCEDGSDENFCSEHKPNAQICNETHQYLCADKNKCIPKTWVCNNETDCDDASDEANCTNFEIAPNSTCKGFLCDGDKCISKLWTCDGSYDCKDESDEDVEKTCRHALRPHTINDGFACREFPGKKRKYKCLDNSFCLTQDQMCDGMKDCKDGSDEGPFCEKWSTMCANFTCKGNTMCTPERTGPACICLVSYELQQYNYTSQQCEDVNDCLQDRPQCSHMCQNGNGNFVCSCEDGYVKDSFGYLCYAQGPEAMLFFSTRNDIRYLKIKSKQQFVVATGIKQAHGVSYDGTYLYWVETAQGHQAIVRSMMGDAYEVHRKEVLVSLGLEDPGDIAIDWLGGNIYFSDTERGIISVCRTNGSACATLPLETKHPRFVTLDARNGNMYWADWRSKPVIMQARMDGARGEVVADELYTFASGLAADAPNQRLYFVDRTIKVLKLQDKKVYSLFEEPYHHPYSIAVFENTVFWSDWTSNTVQTTDKLHSVSEKRNVLLTLDVPVFDMHMYHPALMNRSLSPCERARCSHLCYVTSRTTYACGCPDGMQLEGNECQHAKDFHPQYLIVGGSRWFTRVQYNSLGNPETHAMSFDIGRVQAMAYDSLRDRLYIYDGYLECIKYVDMRDFALGITSMFLYKGLRNIVDMDYDYVTDALYVLDAGRRVVEVISLKTHYRSIVYSFRDQEVPISLCVVPEYGRMLIAVVEKEQNNEIHVDSFGLDGGSRKHVLMTNLRGPHIKLQYSPHMDIVYISDEGQGTIDYVHPEGTGRENFLELFTSVASLAVTDALVFWTDRRTPRLFWADAHEATHKIRRLEFSIFPNNTQLLLRATSPPMDSKNPLHKHPCAQIPSPCSEICVQTSHDHPQQGSIDMGFKCLCSVGYVLVNGQCSEVTKCKADQLFCHRSNGCISKDKKCDGQQDCLEGEDEEGCALHRISGIVSCLIGQIFCNGACVDGSEFCAPTASSTKDAAAPAPAVPPACSSGEFRCANDSSCISRSLACDGRGDCADASDEGPAACGALGCFDTEYMCASGSCIPISWRCDSSEDCLDGSDEVDCMNKTCGFGYFQCNNGECVEFIKRCNHRPDCADHSDEMDCDQPDIVEALEPTQPCLNGFEFPCERNKSICVSLTARCNGKVDCPGSTDEDGCDFRCAPLGLFACKQDTTCLIRKWVCNGKNDCLDGSDETPEACATVNRTSRLFAPPPAPLQCHSGFQCGNGQCVEWRDVCDGRQHCFDGSDEGGLCATPCDEHSCTHSCRRTPVGPQCECPRGYRAAHGACEDIDECVAAPCSHACRNTPGSFVCSCHRGYALRSDQRSCKALHGNMSVLYVSGNSVKSIFADYKVGIEYNDPNIARITDLDYNVRKNQLYVASAETGKLIEVNRTQDNSGATVITNVGRPTRVAVEWVTGNVYFVDSKPNDSCIRVCNVGQKRCAKLLKVPDDAEVTALQVEPAARRLFYCEGGGAGGAGEAALRAAALGGRRGALLATLARCSGLAADSFARTLYVAETGPSRILQMDYQGNNMKTIFTNNPNLQAPHGLAIFEDSIYFLGANSFKLSRCHLHGVKTCEPYLYSVFDANTFVIRHESIQRDDIENVCEGVVCSNVCVMDDSGPQCVCEDGSVSADGSCPFVKQNELALFNGWSQQDTERAHYLSFTLMAVVLALFLLYLVVFAYYHAARAKKNRALDYMQVRYHNSTDGQTQISSSPIIEMPNAGGITHEFVNPLQFMRNIWQQSFRKRSRPANTAGFVFDAQSQQDLSDTESDLDVRENKRILRN